MGLAQAGMMASRTVTGAIALVAMACAVAMVVSAIGASNSSGAHAELLAKAAGMSKDAASQDMETYFKQLKKQVKSASALAQQHLKDEDRDIKGHTPAQSLSAYFDKQATKLHTYVAPSSKLSARAAAADLDSYFDSIPTETKRELKIDGLSNQVASLKDDVHNIIKPVQELEKEVMEPVKELKDKLKESNEETKNALGRLHQQEEVNNKRMMENAEKEGAEINAATGRAVSAAERAATSAEAARKAARAKANVNIVSNIHQTPRSHIKNPKIKVEGLPPGWEAYMDRKTRFAYFFNPKTAESTWVNPKGSRVTGLRDLPAGWEALKPKHGARYYVDLRSGESTYTDPRAIPGGKVLKLLEQSSHMGAAARAAIARDKAAALRDDNGEYAHNWKRSQWADKAWMKFLDPKARGGAGAHQSLRTTGQALREGSLSDVHPANEKVASSSY